MSIKDPNGETHYEPDLSGSPDTCHTCAVGNNEQREATHVSFKTKTDPLGEGVVYPAGAYVCDDCADVIMSEYPREEPTRHGETFTVIEL